MKRLVIFSILISLLTITMYANEDFDPTKNYQFNNAMVYVGETLIVKDFDVNEYPVHCRHYKFFKDMSFIDGRDSENASWKNYHYDLDSPEDCTINGVSPKWLSGKRFMVQSVKRHGNYEYTWIFVLVNVDNKYDKCKFIYHGDADSPLWPGEWSMYLFPFIVEKYAMNLYGKDKYVDMINTYSDTYIANNTDNHIAKRNSKTATDTKQKIQNLANSSNTESFLVTFIKRCISDEITLFKAALML